MRVIGRQRRFAFQSSSPSGRAVRQWWSSRAGQSTRGRYRLDAFEPPIEVTVPGSGWYAAEPTATFAAFNRYPSEPESYIVVLRPAGVYGATYPEVEPLPEDLAVWLHAQPAFTATAMRDATVGGRPAQRFDATVSNPDRTCDLGERMATDCVVLAPIPKNEDFRFGAGDRIRFWVVDVDGPLIIAVSDRPDHFEEFLPQAERVVTSLRFD